MSDEPLSPAAAAVRAAVSAKWKLDRIPTDGEIAAAALRAAADAIAPTKEDRDAVPEFHAQCVMNGVAFAVNELRGIANELEAGR